MHPLPRGWRPDNIQRLAPRGIRLRCRLLSRRVRTFILHNVLHADDPPHRLALGAAIGTFVALTPTIGLQTVLVILLAWLLRANKTIGLPLVWISNPATIVPVYYPQYLLGRMLLGEPGVGIEWWAQLQNPPAGWTEALSFYWARMLEIAVPLWLGCLVVSSAIAAATYYFVYSSVRWYRLRRWGQLLPPSRSPEANAPEHRPENGPS
jgi:uncharacterized protein (DUF2062 family)